MKSLFEHLKDNNYILESFQSDTIRDCVWPNLRRTSWVTNCFKWDQITEDDLEQIGVDRALKLARQRKEKPALILWVHFAGEKSKCIAITSGTYVYWTDPSVFYDGRSKQTRIPEIHYNSTEAILLKDADRFDTRSLREARYEAKKNAAAFKTNEQIAIENEVRYKNLKNRLMASAKYKADVTAWFDQAFAEYQAITSMSLTGFKLLSSNPANSSELQEVIRKFAELNQQFQYCLEQYTKFTKSVEEIQTGDRYIDISAANARAAYNQIKKVAADINDKFVRLGGPDVTVE